LLDLERRPSILRLGAILLNPMMNRLLQILVGLSLVTGAARAVQVGDTRDAVIAQKGAPLGEMKGGSVDILRYTDLTVRLSDGHVIAIEKASGHAASAPIPTKPPAPEPTVAATPAPKTDANPPIPPFPKGFVGHPIFQTTAGVQGGGTAFLARAPGDSRAFILTVHHLLGPDGGFRVLISHEQVPSFVQRIALGGLFGPSKSHPVEGCFVPSQGTLDDPLFEMAAFKAPDAVDEDVVELEKSPPLPGARVWVIGHVRGGVPEGELIHPARVTAFPGPWLWAEFDNPNIITNGASGAPVIDADGRVVGIYRGHDEQNGHKYAMIIPAPLVIKTLQGL
jgi:hypothetical protein